LAKKKKSKKGKIVVIGVVIGLIIAFLLNGNLSLDLFGGEEQMDREPLQVENQSSEETNDIVIEVVDNKIFVNEKEVLMEDLMSEVGEYRQVIYRAKDAKQITYDEVKSLLKSNDIIIIEE